MSSENSGKQIIEQIHDENGFLVGVKFKRHEKKTETQPKTKTKTYGRLNKQISQQLDTIAGSVEQTLDNSEKILSKLNQNRQKAKPVITINAPKNVQSNKAAIAPLPQTKKIIFSNDILTPKEKKAASFKSPRIVKNMPYPEDFLKINPQIEQKMKADGHTPVNAKPPRKESRVVVATHPDQGMTRAVPRDVQGGQQRKQQRDEKGRFTKTQKEQKEQTKILRKILKKRSGGSGEENGIFAGLLKKYPGIGLLGHIAGLIPGVSLLTGALGESSIGRLGGKALSGIGLGAKKLKRNIGENKNNKIKTTAQSQNRPDAIKESKLGKLSRKLGKWGKISGLLGLGLTAFDAFGVENSNMDRANKNKQHVKNAAGLGGSLAGGWAGMQAGAAIGSIVPGYGTAIGGVIGGVAGAIGGTALADYGIKLLDKAIDPETSKKMLGSWDGFISVTKAGFQKMYQSMPQPVQKLAKQAEATVKTTQQKVVATAQTAQKKVAETGKVIKEKWDNSAVGKVTNQAIAGVSGLISKSIASMTNKHGAIGYKLGSKSLNNNVIDCSGWVNAVQQATIADINRNIGAGTISVNKAKAMRLAAAQGGAAGEVEYAMKQGGAMQDDQITENKLKDGMVIGMAKNKNGRFKNIGHVVTVFTDPKTGVKMISESATAEGNMKAGVRVRTAKEYLATEAKRRSQNKNRHLYAGDPFAQERAVIDKNDFSVQAANGVATVTATALTPNSPTVLPSGMPNYAFRFGGGVDEHLHEASKRFDISEATLRGFALKEGGWKGKDSQTGAIGVGQFTESTWNSLIKKFPQDAAAIGMTKINDNNRRKANDPRRNNRVNSLAMALYITKEIDPTLKRKGIPITDENRYLNYNIGNGILPLLAGENINAEKRKKLEKLMILNGKKGKETQQQWLKRQGASINTSKAKANVLNNPTINPAQKATKAIQVKKGANNQAIQARQINVKPIEIAAQTSKPAHSALAFAAYSNTNVDGEAIAHMPTRQVSQKHIAHVVSGSTSG